MLGIRIEGDGVAIGGHLRVTFQRTLRIPDDGKLYPLPPGLGALPVHLASELGDTVPGPWRRPGTLIVPMYRREALWLGFHADARHPCAVQVAVGRMNAVTGEPWGGGLRARPQNYLVCPPQPWLDGINTGAGVIRQFVAIPLGRGRTVEVQVTGHERYGGIQIRVYEARPGAIRPRRAEPAEEGRARRGEPRGWGWLLAARCGRRSTPTRTGWMCGTGAVAARSSSTCCTPPITGG